MDNIIKAIKTGIDTEIKGLKFYESALKKVQNPNSQGLLSFLIREEKRHLALFKEIEKKIVKGKSQEANDEVLKFEHHSYQSPIFTKEALKKIKDKRSDILTIFDTAKEIERKGIEMYTDFAEQADELAVKALFLKLAEEEEEHERLISMHSEALYNSRYWDGMDEPEPIRS
jgi:rubrerythrin